MTKYKEIEMKEALMRYADGEIVYYRYFTNGGYSRIGSLGLDHLRRNPDRYTFYIEEPKKTLWDKRNPESINSIMYAECDVKEALKEFLDYVIEKVYIQELTSVQNKAKEIFGEELLE